MWTARVALTAAVALASAAGPAAAADPRDVHPGAWSYFGDPRSIAVGEEVFTGWVGTRREIMVEQFDRRTGRSRNVQLHRNTELDDHDNPSLALFRGHLYVFYSPHSGRIFPRDRASKMRYRVSLARTDIRAGFGRTREVRTNTRGGMGFTYPNPIAAGGRLWLFWRGGNWYPTFSYTRDGHRWVPARTLVLGPRGQRPYAKYVAGPDGAVHMVFSDAHPSSYRTSLHYMRYRAGRFERADGSLIGTMRDLPLPVSSLDRVYAFSEDQGRAWPHDVAVLDDGRPAVVYTRRMGGPNGRDTFVYARWDGSLWRRHDIVAAGQGGKTFTSGGITFDHADPARVVLSRTVDRFNEIELWRTRDLGATWREPFPVTTGSRAHNIRPVIPRGFRDTASLLVVYAYGSAQSFRAFRMTIRMSLGAPPPRTPIPFGLPVRIGG